MGHYLQLHSLMVILDSRMIWCTWIMVCWVHYCWLEMWCYLDSGEITCCWNIGNSKLGQYCTIKVKINFIGWRRIQNGRMRIVKYILPKIADSIFSILYNFRYVFLSKYLVELVKEVGFLAVLLLVPWERGRVSGWISRFKISLWQSFLLIKDLPKNQCNYWRLVFQESNLSSETFPGINPLSKFMPTLSSG